MGINNFATRVYILRDESAISPTWQAVRGRLNAAFVVEPLSSSRVLVTYIVEVEPGGWCKVMDKATIDFFAGDSVLVFLKEMHLHFTNKAKEAQLGIDDEALRRFRQTLAQKESFSHLDDLDTAGISASDLEETIRLLEQQLQRLNREDKLGFSALIKKKQHELANARARLRKCKAST
jgi:hypothetical protein